MYERSLSRLLAGGREHVLLLGPRQVGKSTLLNGLGPDLALNLASPTTFRDYVTDPGRLERELAAAPRTVRTVLIDEVQRVPPLLDVLQVVIDGQPRRFRFLLSGSSARKLHRGHANLLPGRIVRHHLHPLLACELGAAFDLDRTLAHGTLPGSYADTDDQRRADLLRTYADVYLREEVQAEALVRDIGGFARLLDLVAASSGRVINLHAMSKDAAVSYETARRYLDVLDDTLVLFRIPAWTGSDRTAIVAHPKLLLFDLGVRNALLRRPLTKPMDDERGLLLEHLVGLELRRREGTLWPDARVHHFRTRRGAEVDFVVSVGRDVWGVEVKASRRVDARDLRGFAALADHAPRLKRRVVVYLGPRRQQVGDVELVPLEMFLAELPAPPASK